VPGEDRINMTSRRQSQTRSLPHFRETHAFCGNVIKRPVSGGSARASVYRIPEGFVGIYRRRRAQTQGPLRQSNEI
jgi:hypothetical protein